MTDFTLQIGERVIVKGTDLQESRVREGHLEALRRGEASNEALVYLVRFADETTAWYPAAAVDRLDAPRVSP